MESWYTRLMRWRFNLFPAYRRTGGRVTYLEKDFREARVRLPLNRGTRNYVGTTFGGSMYGAVDPVYMVLLIQRLGRDYVVWDKAASIRFRKPARATLFAKFRVDDDEVDAIRSALEHQPAVDRVYYVDLVDGEGTVHATVEKILHVKRRPPPE